MRDTYNWMVGDQEVDAESATTYVFLIYTPVLLIVSWVLEIIVDRPAKEFAGELDRFMRRKRPKPVPEKNADGEMVSPDPVEYYATWTFWKRNWPCLAFILWLLVVFIFTELYDSFHDYKP